MKVMVNVLEPITTKSGVHKVVAKKVEEDIPDLGREHLFCNWCGFSAYPECKKECCAYLPAEEQKRLAALERR